MKAIIVWIVVLLASSLPALEKEKDAVPPNEEIVATVGETIITRNELEKEIEIRLATQELDANHLRYDKPKLTRLVLERIIDQQLCLQEAEKEGRKPEYAPIRRAGRYGLTRRNRPREIGGAEPRSPLSRYVTDCRVDAEIARRAGELRAQGWEMSSHRDYFDHVKQALSLSRWQTRERIRKELAVGMYMTQEVFLKIGRHVTPSETRYYYRKNRAEFAAPERLSFRQIFLPGYSSASQVAAAEVEKALKSGRSFLGVAKEYSLESEISAENGQIRELEPDTLSALDEYIWNFLKKRPTKEATPPFGSPRGIHFFYVVDRVEGTPKPYEEVQSEIQEKIFNKRYNDGCQELLDHLRKKQRVKIFLPDPKEPVKPIRREKSDSQPSPE